MLEGPFSFLLPKTLLLQMGMVLFKKHGAALQLQLQTTKVQKRKQVLTLFQTLGEMILIQTTFGVKFRKNTKHLAQQETSGTNLGRFWFQWGVTGDPLQPATVMPVFGFCNSPSLKQASFLKRDNFQGFWVFFSELYSKGALCPNSAWFPGNRGHYFNIPV